MVLTVSLVNHRQTLFPIQLKTQAFLKFPAPSFLIENISRDFNKNRRFVLLQ